MKILDIDDIEVPEEEIDLDKGYITSEQVLKKHHAAVPEQKETFHYEVKTWYFEDGTELDVSELGNADPHVKIVDLDNGVFEYIDQGEGKIYRGADISRIVDQEQVEGKEAWDEYEEIQRYTLYTEEQLEQQKAEQEEKAKQEELLSSGLERIKYLEDKNQSFESNISDNNTAIQELQTSSEIFSDRIATQSNQIHDQSNEISLQAKEISSQSDKIVSVTSDIDDIILIVSELIGMETEESDWDEELGDFVSLESEENLESEFETPIEEAEEENV